MSRLLHGEDAANSWLFVLPWDLYHVGGVNQVVENLYDSMAQQGDSPPVLMVSSWKHARASESAPKGRTTVHLRLPTPLRGRRPIMGLFGWLFRLPATLRALSKVVVQKRVLTINPHYPDLDILNWLLLRGLRRTARFRILASFHGRDLERVLGSGWLERRLWEAIFRRVDAISTCSSSLTSRLVAEFGLDASKVFTLDNGVDPAKISRALEGARAPELPDNYILSLGTLEHKKGHDVLLKAFDRVAATEPSISLVIAGRPGPPEDVQAIRAVRSHCASRDRIVLLENLPHDQAMFALSRARLFVLASRREPFGIAILEAALLGCPVIATDECGVLARLDGYPIRVVPADSVDHLTKVLAQAIAEPPPEGIAELRAAVRARFGWSSVVRQYQNAVPAPEGARQEST